MTERVVIGQKITELKFCILTQEKLVNYVLELVTSYSKIPLTLAQETRGLNTATQTCHDKTFLQLKPYQKSVVALHITLKFVTQYVFQNHTAALSKM